MTLSACDTAAGKLEGEEGIDGLAEALLLARAKSVVGALWEVEDPATDTLMRSFYIGSKNQGGAYVPPFFGGMYAPSRKGRRHAKLRHVCAIPDFHRVSRANDPKRDTW